MTDSLAVSGGANANRPIDPTLSSGEPGPNYLDDAPLSRLLSRLSAIHGRSVPAFRFGMLSETRSGVPVANLSRHDRAVELWLAHFPQGQARSVTLSDLQRSDYPVFWVSENQQQVLLIRGPMSNGGFNAEDDEGHPLDLSAQQVGAGKLLLLKTDGEAWSGLDEKPHSATEWFNFALRKHRRIFVEAVVATALVSVFGMASALYTMQVYDRVVPNKGYATLAVLTIGVLIAIAFELSMKHIKAVMVDRASKAIDQELSSVFFGKALDIRMDARPATVGTFSAQIQHFQSVRNFMTSSTIFILTDAPFALLFIVVVAIIAGPVALVPLIIVPVAVFAGLAFRKPIEKTTFEHMHESNYKNGLLIEAIDGIESVKAAGAEWKLLERWRHLTAQTAESDLKLRLMSMLSTNITMSIQQLSYVGIISVGAYLVSNGSLTIGGLIACSIISGRAFAPLARMPDMIVQWKQAKIALKALDDIMAMPSDREEGARLIVPEGCNGNLRLEKVTFQYLKDTNTIEVPSLQIGPGERVAIVGPVGSGKSTLIKVLSGLFKPTTGTLYLDGVDVNQLAPEFVREHIGYLPQDVRLFNGTLRENLTLGLPSPSDSQILRAAGMTGLDQAIQDHPRGLELQIAEGGRGLSGGQRQLVGLTRLLLAQPKIILLDEPTASMDAQLEARVMQHLFKEIAPNSVLVVVTHKAALLPHASRILVMNRGTIALDGPRDDVLARMRGQQPTPVPGPSAS